MSPVFNFSQFPVLDTPRLRLRQLTASDASAVMRFRGDYEVTKLNIGPAYTELGQAQGMIAGIQADYDARITLRWGLALRAADVVIGQIGFNHWARNDMRASIGFDLARDYWRQGLMTEALHAVLQFGFTQMRLNRVEADASAENHASIGLMIKAGFRQEGCQREQYYANGRFHDLLLFGLLKREYGGLSHALEP